jgi:hypothetical protein
MIETFLKILDKIIDLLKQHKQANKDLLATIVEPLFSETALIVNDYMSVFTDARQTVIDGSDDALMSTIDSIAARRQQLLTTRAKVREMACAVSETFEDDLLTSFAEHILALLYSSQIAPYRLGSTPSKVLLIELHDLLENPDLDRTTIRLNIEQVLHNIESNWTNVTRAYARLKLQLIH